jgi:phospholipid transport system substrate-binding protein
MLRPIARQIVRSVARSIVCVLAVLSLMSFRPSFAAGSAADTVTTFHRILLDTMRDGASLGCSGRAQRLTPAIDTAFDLPALSALALRRRWSTLDDAQRQAFTASFRKLAIATYASRFATFSGERFETRDTVKQADGTELVHARLYPSKSDPVSFDYVLHDNSGQWKIINVIADGVSDLALRSTQYEQIMRQRGYDGLMLELKTQTENAQVCK